MLRKLCVAAFLQKCFMYNLVSYRGTQGILDPEASLACMATMAQEVIQGFPEKEEFLDQEAPK